MKRRKLGWERVGPAPRATLWIFCGVILIGLLLLYQGGALTDGTTPIVTVDSLHVDGFAVAQDPSAQIVVENMSHRARQCFAWFRPGRPALFLHAPRDDSVRTATFTLDANQTLGMTAHATFPVAASAKGVTATVRAGVRCGNVASPTMTVTVVIAP